MSEPLKFDQRKDLACWFGLSYASFLVLPRVLMQDIPPEWQERLAVLLNEYDDAFPNQPEYRHQRPSYPQWQIDQDAAMAAELPPSSS